MVDPTDRPREAQLAQAMPGILELVGHPGGRHLAGTTAAGAELVWERHREASTATILYPLDVDATDLSQWIGSMPGDVVRATKLTIVPSEDSIEPAIMPPSVAESDLVTCYLGPCRMWSDFRLSDDGYGRVLLAANGCAPADLGRIVQRLQELGNYRNLALLGLPTAQRFNVRLDNLERALANHAQVIAEGVKTEEDVLEQISIVSAELAHISSETGYRMDATQAYAAIASDRLKSLEVAPIAGHQSLADFTDRRLVPAVRTCAHFAARLEKLSSRAARVAALLRTRIETRIERQNRDLLRSVGNGIRLQIRLQHLVESLSVLAISYYAVSLLAYLSKGLAKELPGVSAELVTALAVVPVTGAIFLFIRSVRKGLLPHYEQDRSNNDDAD